MQTTFSTANQALSFLAQKYGVTNYNSWQMLRVPFWSYAQFTPSATGISTLSLFGNVAGVASANRQLTNMPKANSFGQQHFMIKAVRTDYFIPSLKFAETNYLGTDATTLASDFVNGVFQSGVFTLRIDGKPQLQLPLPFLLAPPAGGDIDCITNGLTSATIGNRPSADLSPQRDAMFTTDPSILVTAEQTISASFDWPRGLCPVNATSIINDSTNPLYLGCILDGVLFRAAQS